MKIVNTAEPLNKGRVGTSLFVLCREVVLSLGVLVLWESEHLSFIEKLFLLYPLFGGSTIGGSSTVYELLLKAREFNINLYIIIIH